MGLFSKELSDYKVMERYKKSLDIFYEFGETERYCLFLDKRLKQYIMRQDKCNPKNVVYLGWLRGEYCVFYGRIFFINKTSYTGRLENPLNYIDVETGDAGNISVLSNKGCWLARHWHCQDIVNKVSIQQDALVIEVTRYKENVHDEKELSYTIYVTYVNGKFEVNSVFPDMPVKEQNDSQKTVKKIDAKSSLSYSAEPIVEKPVLTYGTDIALQVKSEREATNKVTYDAETVACGLAELAIKELLDLIGICSRQEASYDERKLVISTFVYYFEVWLFNFSSITLRQTKEVEKIYKEKFSAFNRKKFEDASYKSVLENETQFDQMLREVDRKIRTSYHENNRTFLDDGLTDSFILSFIINLEDKGKIKEYIVNKVFKEWAYTAKQADKLMTIEG